MCIKKEMGFSSFCALIFCILLTSPVCWALWVCGELCNAWLGTAEWAEPELVYISYFLYFAEKSQRKTIVLEGNNVTKEKMISTSSLMGLGAHSGFQLSRAAPPLPSPTVLSANALDLRS